jgi:predicted metal-binding membrane protein
MASAVGRGGSAGPGQGYVAARARLGLILALFTVAASGWVWTARELRGMDAGPWTALGSLTGFLGTWVVMMAAMMFPSVAPTIALYTKVTKRSDPLSPWLFASGYLLTWTGAGLVAYAIGVVAGAIFGDALAWDQAGRLLAAVTLLMAAAYEVTPLKNVCLAKCRSPLGSFLGSWRGGRTGAVRMGMRNGTWCVACCWALMASLFALGLMSVSWMAVVAGIIAIEKSLPWPRAATMAAAAVLLAVGLLLMLAPQMLPGLTIPTAAMN